MPQLTGSSPPDASLTLPTPQLLRHRTGAFVWSSSIGDGFAGGAGYEVEITNVGHHPRTLMGVPGVAAVRSNGHIVGTRVPGSSHGPLITLQPRATAHVGLTVHDAGAICGHDAAERPAVTARTEM